jgi:predicted O-methyltransferase YrrM
MPETLQPLLRELEQFGRQNDAHVSGRGDKMLNITPETGELLSILVGATKTKRVLEIGTSNGYSTLWLAEAVQAQGGRVVTVEVSPAKAALARRNFERAALTNWIRLEVMEAGDFLGRQLPSGFDFLFLDSDRRQYKSWWPSLHAVLEPGGLLVADNAVSHAAEMEEFTKLVAASGRYRSLVVPIGNGEFVALKEGPATPS